jgi:hypothetical protein
MVHVIVEVNKWPKAMHSFCDLFITHVQRPLPAWECRERLAHKSLLGTTAAAFLLLVVSSLRLLLVVSSLRLLLVVSSLHHGRSLAVRAPARGLHWSSGARTIAPAPLSEAINEHGARTSCFHHHFQDDQRRDLFVLLEDAVQERIGRHRLLQAPRPRRRIPLQPRAVAELAQRPHVAVLLVLDHKVVGKEEDTVRAAGGASKVDEIRHAHAGRARRHHADGGRAGDKEAPGLGELLAGLAVLLVAEWHVLF